MDSRSNNNMFSNCVPIPNRKKDLTLNYAASLSPIVVNQNDNRYDNMVDLGSSSYWSQTGNDNDIKMDDDAMNQMSDDIFQVDKSDLIQDNSLQDLENLCGLDELMLPADLDFNSVHDSFLSSTTCGMLSPQNSLLSPHGSLLSPHDSLLSPQSNYLPNTPVGSFAPSSFQSQFISDGSPFNSNSNMGSSSSSPLNIVTDTRVYTPLGPRSAEMMSPGSRGSAECNIATSPGSFPTILLPNHSLPRGESSLHELLMRRGPISPVYSEMGQSMPKSGPIYRRTERHRNQIISRLSSSAPTHLGLEQIWQRREPKPHLLSTGSLIEAGSTSSLSTAGVMSPEYDYSMDDMCDSELDSDHEEEYSSDNDSGSDGEGISSSVGTSSMIPSTSRRTKKERYFWQYNVQAKGPKGQRLVLKTQQEDPHRLNQVTDPVFSPECYVQGIKHSGKARKGDGNDLTPNPKKLNNIGKELEKLNRTINELTPVNELPYNVRNQSRKEKNKLASRACRLKKKAQHEANKIKLYGLDSEHKRLIHGIQQMKQMILSSFLPESSLDHDLSSSERIVKYATRLKVAGHTTEFVNKVLDRSKGGLQNGGLEELCGANGSFGNVGH